MLHRRMRERFDTLVVGAGYAGAIMAERLASRCGHSVLVVDRRDHIAGNAYDYLDESGVRVHAHGPHIFHTNSSRVVEYLSRFTGWRPYEHRVLAKVGEQLLPVPINRTTLNLLYGLDLRTDEEAASCLADRAEPIAFVRTSEDVVVSKVGRDLYEKFFGRIPTRTNTDDRYFTDWHQAMPADGYTPMFERILDHPAIEVRLGVNFEEIEHRVEYGHLVYTGPIDAFFGFEYGALPYRSLEFELRNAPTTDGGLLQPVAQINFPSEGVPWTRAIEYRHLTGQVHNSSTIAIEYPRSEGDPYYPIPRDETRALYKRYEARAAKLPNATFVGRLARYQYLNMDQVVAQALSAFDRLVETGQISLIAAPAS
jgi:UDP-galactopyranose mutase